MKRYMNASLLYAKSKNSAILSLQKGLFSSFGGE